MRILIIDENINNGTIFIPLGLSLKQFLGHKLNKMKNKKITDK